MSISDSNPEDEKNHNRPITGSFGFSNSVQHGIRISFVLVLLSPVVPFAGAQSGETPRDPYQYAKFSPSMAIIIGVLIAALFFMGLFSIYIRNCTQARTGGTVRPLTGPTGRSRRGMRGLDPAVIETFPTFVYSVVKGLKIGKGALECAVCLNEFEDDETLRLLPKCDHVFHPECIDAWLDSHTTCPVCRANLVPQPGDEIVAVQIPELNNEPDGEDRRSELIERENEEVSVHIVEDLDQDLQVPEVINPSRSINQNRPPRSKSVRSRLFGKFPRSHSTGHSLVQPGENCDRFTLRLPVEVRKQIVSGKLNRTTSCVVLPREGSSRRGYRTGGEGSNRGRSFRRLNRSDRWIFSMTRSFFSRAPSVRSPKVTADGEGTSSTTPRGFATTPFNCLGSRRDEPGLLSDEPGRPPV